MCTMYSITVKKDFSFENMRFYKGQNILGSFEEIGNRNYFKSDSLWIRLDYLDEKNVRLHALQQRKNFPIAFLSSPFLLFLIGEALTMYIIRRVARLRKK